MARMNPFQLLRPTLLAALLVVGGSGVPQPAYGISITGYSSAVNDRFSAGFPSAPVDNTNLSFIGAGLDWDGVGWATNDPTKGFGFLSPQHYLVARHYGGATNVRVFAHGEMETGAQASVENTGYGAVFTNETVGDLSLGTLSTPLVRHLPRYAVLDLNATSSINSPSAYHGLEVLLYGRGPNGSSSPRIGQTTISSVTVSGNSTFFSTSRTQVQLEVGDSGSPAFHRWTNPNGGQELTLLGNHAAISPTENFINFLATSQAMGRFNLFMNDEGFALRVVGNPTNTWAGTSNTNINRNGNWGFSFFPDQIGATSDAYVSFNGSTSASKSVSVNANYNLRGLYFLSTAAANDGFSFNGTSTLTIGRGGVTNYDNSRQIFQAPLVLGDAQYWDGGVGAITVANLETNGRLLEITGQGINRITGVVSGSGGLAVSGGTLELSGNNTYSGRTWVHAGTLLVTNIAGSATGSGNLTVAPGAILAGNGTISGPIRLGGSLRPGGDSIGTLTAQSSLTWDAQTPWNFQLGSSAPTLGAAETGGSSQDRLLLTGINSSFVRGSGNSGDYVFDFTGTGQVGWYRLVQWTGTTTFLAGDFSAWNLTAGYEATFSIQGSAVYLQVTQAIPEPSSVFLFGLGGLWLFWWRRGLSRPVAQSTS